MLADVITVVAPDSARIMYYMYDLPAGGVRRPGPARPGEIREGQPGVRAQCTQLRVFDGDALVPVPGNKDFVSADLRDPNDYTSFGD